MSEIKETKDLGKNETKQSELGKVAEKLTDADKNLDNVAEETTQLSEEELNEPIDEVVMPVMESGDCRSECKYNTGDRSKYSNYGYSD